VSTLRAVTLDTVSTIKNSASTTVLTTNTSEPLLTVGTGANTIKARNTAKWWVAATGVATIQSSYGVASLTDNGNSIVTINLTTATSVGSHYACGGSYDHASGILWASTMNYAGTPNTTSHNFRFSYADAGNSFTPRAWGAIGFGDQA
jgi:hypothetical protein